MYSNMFRTWKWGHLGVSKLNQELIHIDAFNRVEDERKINQTLRPLENRGKVGHPPTTEASLEKQAFYPRSS
jgi:hypothetical protein